MNRKNSSFRSPMALVSLLVLTLVTTRAAQAQTYNILHTFSGGGDGGFPIAGLTMDRAGNLYGTANSGGAGYGTVYQLKHKGSNWLFAPLYSFAGLTGSDGAGPESRVIFGPNGTLYGTTVLGGFGSGTVYNLRPQAKACPNIICPWTETVLYRFVTGADGYLPVFGDLIFDQAGNIYGTTYQGNPYEAGTVYELTPSGGGWTESILYSFTGSDGLFPYHGVISDGAGSLYGTTERGGAYFGGSNPGYGTVFRLTPSGSGWKESVLYSFQNGSDGEYPDAGLIFDPSGNLYGATDNGGQDGGGTVFKLSPSSGGWTFTLLYSFTGDFDCGPYGTLVMDGAGSLYGTTLCDGANHAGSVFKLTPSGNSWTYTSLHDFTGGSDGENPYCNVVFDANGNLYGTASAGGLQGYGVVWEIAP